MKKRSISAFSALLALALLLSCAGCGKKTALSKSTTELTAGMQGSQAKTLSEVSDAAGAADDFAVNIFQKCFDGKNTLISPVSILCALGMTANGAQSQTLGQMEQVFGIDTQALGEYMGAYMASLPQAEKYKLEMANSIWIKDDEKLTVEQEFLRKNADTYLAGVYKAAFDSSTLGDINSWVSEKTDGMIDTVLEEIPEDAIMYLINALSFDAEWESVYTTTQVRNGQFTTEAGGKRDVELMYSAEHAYLESENASGFIKYYSGRKYAFAALLPEEGVSMEEFIASLSGEKLRETLEKPVDIKVNAAIPKFKCEYGKSLSKLLKGMGMPDAFDPYNADFGALGSYENRNIYISEVLHKAYIEVDERGTKAGAVTVVEMAKGTMAVTPEEEKTVYLDRPFVYMLIDCEENLPLFIGAVTDIG